MAAVAEGLQLAMRKTVRHEPEYADFRDQFAPYLEREIVLARLNERTMHALGGNSRNVELNERLRDLDVLIRQIEARNS